MLRSIFIFILCISAQLTFAQSTSVLLASNDTEKSAAITWNQQTYDFGAIEKGIPVSAEFVLTNESELPISIETAKTSCGCTLADYAKEPIMPGESTTIMATYNAKREGAFSKTVTVVTSNQDQPYRLVLKGNVNVAQE